jgi:hypothetical protein
MRICQGNVSSGQPPMAASAGFSTGQTIFSGAVRGIRRTVASHSARVYICRASNLWRLQQYCEAGCI